MKSQLPRKTMLGEWTQEECRMMARWYALRKLGLLYPIIHTEGYCLFTFCPAQRWDGMVPLDWDRLKADIEAAETVIITKKEVGSCTSASTPRADSKLA